eukprot:CAMPEP_0178390786 /NCGR_PEP_ID=MMETSP0689_2-20121128/10825_1 /TAXON_ID=160604 /ORGANISM="Amphidinium massartii, Strain CS-259" /LENGTH=749 /DNA_ID=CAMNT_0020011305 /DNA_START=1 /DNA_END=2251 /DNA_ORIENTATION=+
MNVPTWTFSDAGCYQWTGQILSEFQVQAYCPSMPAYPSPTAGVAQPVDVSPSMLQEEIHESGPTTYASVLRQKSMKKRCPMSAHLRRWLLLGEGGAEGMVPKSNPDAVNPIEMSPSMTKAVGEHCAAAAAARMAAKAYAAAELPVTQAQLAPLTEVKAKKLVAGVNSGSKRPSKLPELPVQYERLSRSRSEWNSLLTSLCLDTVSDRSCSFRQSLKEATAKAAELQEDEEEEKAAELGEEDKSTTTAADDEELPRADSSMDELESERSSSERLEQSEQEMPRADSSTEEIESEGASSERLGQSEQDLVESSMNESAESSLNAEEAAEPVPVPPEAELEEEEEALPTTAAPSPEALRPVEVDGKQAEPTSSSAQQTRSDAVPEWRVRSADPQNSGSQRSDKSRRKQPARGSKALDNLAKTENAYKVNRARLSHIDELKRTVQSQLNKICPENATTIARQLGQAHLRDVSEMELLIRLIFEKALAEPHYCETYADLALALRTELPEFAREDGSKPITFKAVLLNYCQHEFDSLPTVLEWDAEQSASMDPEELEFRTKKRKDRALANMKFIGHLFLRQLLSTKVISSVAQDLAGCQDESTLPKEHVIECLCELLMATGLTLEAHPIGKHAVTQVCSRLLDIKQRRNAAGKSCYSKRLQFMVQDLLDARNAGWRKKTFVSAATTKDEIKMQMEVKKAPAAGVEVVVGQRPAHLSQGQAKQALKAQRGQWSKGASLRRTTLLSFLAVMGPYRDV